MTGAAVSLKKSAGVRRDSVVPPIEGSSIALTSQVTAERSATAIYAIAFTPPRVSGLLYIAMPSGRAAYEAVTFVQPRSTIA